MVQWLWCSGCGAVVVVQSFVVRFQPSAILFSVKNCIEKTKNIEKEVGNGPIFLKKSFKLRFFVAFG